MSAANGRWKEPTKFHVQCIHFISSSVAAVVNARENENFHKKWFDKAQVSY